MGLGIVAIGPFQMPCRLKLPDMFARSCLERKFRRILPTISLNLCRLATPVHVDSMWLVEIDRRGVKVCHYSFAVANGRWISDEPFRDAGRGKCAVMQQL